MASPLRAFSAQVPRGPLFTRRRSGVVIESFSALAHDAPSDEAFEGPQWSVILRSNETDRIANGMRAAGPTDPMDVILGVHRKIVIHHV